MVIILVTMATPISSHVKDKNSMFTACDEDMIFVWLARSVKPHYGITWFIYLFIYLFVYERRAPVTWSSVYGLRDLVSAVYVVCVY